MWYLIIIGLSIIISASGARHTQRVLQISYAMFGGVISAVLCELHRRNYSAPKCYKKFENTLAIIVLSCCLYLIGRFVKEQKSNVFLLFIVLSTLSLFIWVIYTNSFFSNSLYSSDDQ